MLPSWLTNDLAKQSLYAHSIHEATNAIAYSGRFLALRTATILSTTLFGIANFIFFTQRTEECQSLENTYRDIGGALLATGLGWLANRIITPLFDRQPSSQSSREFSGPNLSKRKPLQISSTESTSHALTILPEPTQRMQSILDDLKQQPDVGVHYKGNRLTLSWKNKTLPIYLPSHIKRLLSLSEGNHRFTPEDLFSGLHQLQAAARGPHLSLPGSSNATQIVPMITHVDTEEILALTQGTEEQSEADRVVLKFLSKVALGDAEAHANFVYSYYAVFGRGALANVNLFEHLLPLYINGSDFVKIQILQLLTNFLAIKASLPTDPQASESLKLDMEFLLAQIHKFEGEHAKVLTALRQNLYKHIAENWPNSCPASSSSQQPSPVQMPLADLLTDLKGRARKYSLSEKRLYKDALAYLEAGIAGINPSEFDSNGENTPTLSAYTDRVNLVTHAAAGLILLSKKPQNAFNTIFKALERSEKNGAFGVSVALSAALQVSPVNRLKYASQSQASKLREIADLAGLSSEGMRHMYKLREDRKLSLPSVPTLKSAVVFAREISMTSGGVVNLSQVEKRMQQIRSIKGYLEVGRLTSRTFPQPSQSFTTFIDYLSEIAKGRITEQKTASSSTEVDTPTEFVERILRELSHKIVPYRAELR
jgi:hypothetical protein